MGGTLVRCILGRPERDGGNEKVRRRDSKVEPLRLHA
jgi:hypothetical protein